MAAKNITTGPQSVPSGVVINAGNGGAAGGTPTSLVVVNYDDGTTREALEISLGKAIQALRMNEPGL